MEDNEQDIPELEPVDLDSDLQLTPDDTQLGLKKEIEEIYNEAIEYILNLTQTSNSNTYKTIIKTNPTLKLGYIGSEGKDIVASNLEIIATSPDFNGPGGMTVNILSGKDAGHYSFGKKYDKPKKLGKAYLNLIAEIKRKHRVNKSLDLDLYPIN